MSEDVISEDKIENHYRPVVAEVHVSKAPCGKDHEDYREYKKYFA